MVVWVCLCEASCGRPKRYSLQRPTAMPCSMRAGRSYQHGSGRTCERTRHGHVHARVAGAFDEWPALCGMGGCTRGHWPLLVWRLQQPGPERYVYVCGRGVQRHKFHVRSGGCGCRRLAALGRARAARSSGRVWLPETPDRTGGAPHRGGNSKGAKGFTRMHLAWLTPSFPFLLSIEKTISVSAPATPKRESETARASRRARRDSLTP